MAAITGAAIAVGTAAYSANQQKKAASQGAAAMQKATDQSVAEQQRQYDQNRQDQMPWMQAGQNALGQMQALNSGDFSSFKQSPDYQFAFDQGLQAINRSAAARGGLRSGGTDVDLTRFGQGLATQNYSNYYNRLAGLAGQGQGTAQNLGAAGQATANNLSNLWTGNANTRMSAYQQRADANSQMASAIGGVLNRGINQYGAGR
jgi:hypothetical protein